MTSLQQAPAGLPGTGWDLLRLATRGKLVADRALDVPDRDRTGPATASLAAAD